MTTAAYVIQGGFGDYFEYAEFDTMETYCEFIKLCRENGIGRAYGVNCGWVQYHAEPPVDELKMITMAALEEAMKADPDDFTQWLALNSYILDDPDDDGREPE